MKCGILFNGKQNFFKPYLTWILERSETTRDFKISGIHTNNRGFFSDNFSDYRVDLVDNVDSLLDDSDLVLSLGYWKILKKNQIEKVPAGVINFHHSYMLKYKGRHCATWAIKNGEIYHGSTIHFVDEKVDEGKIIDTDKFIIERYHTAEDIFLMANDIGLRLLKKNFKKIINKEKLEYKNKEKNFFTYREKDMSHEVNKNLIVDKERFLREVRSLTFSNKPAPYILIEGQRIYLKHENYDSGILGEINDERKG